ncbi:MAG: HTTM domain-containing protein [Planctomycetaceae bacterium]
MPATSSFSASRPAGWTTTLRNFFEADEVPYGLALVRILLPLGLLMAFLPRWSRARELFSTDGAPTPLWENYGYPHLLPEPTAVFAVAACTVTIFALISLSLGWMTRVSSLLCLILVPYLSLLDMLSTLTKYSIIASHLLLLLSLSRAGDVWSVDAWIRRRQQQSPPLLEQLRSPVWPRRLMQILLAIIYLAAAITKMQTTNFFSGDQLHYWLLTDVNLDHPLGKWLAQYPSLIVAMSLSTLVWECSFLFVCWSGRGRAIALSIGVVFHAMTYFLLGLHIFPVVSLAIYAAFFGERDYRHLITRCRVIARRYRETRWMVRWERLTAYVRSSVNLLVGAPGTSWLTPYSGGTIFCGLMCVAVVSGVEVERRLDLYGVQRAEGPHQLQEIADEKVAKMFSTERIRPVDSLFQFDVGVGEVAGTVALRQSSFQQGDEAVILCSAAPPHSDMFVEVNLHDDQNRIIKQMSTIIPREQHRALMRYPLTEAYPPGHYEFVLRYDGQEVSRKRITLIDSDSPSSGAKFVGRLSHARK